MKKLIAFVLALVCMLGLVGCSNGSIKGIDKATEIEVEGIDKATKIEVVQYDIGEEVGTVTLTEETSIKHIVDNLNSLKLEKMKYNQPTAIEYKLTFYNADGEMIKTISITLDGWVDYHGSFHSVTSGELDRAYIAGLFE